MKKIASSVVWIAVLALVLSAGIVVAGDKPAKISVVIDRGIDKESMNQGEIKNLNQVGEWMDTDLIKLLEKAGYEAELLMEESDYKAADGAYLLLVKIKNYNPGSKAARMVVGWGAGAASMDTSIELLNGKKSILTDNFSIGSGRDWKKVIRKIDQMTVAAVKGKVQ